MIRDILKSIWSIFYLKVQDMEHSFEFFHMYFNMGKKK